MIEQIAFQCSQFASSCAIYVYGMSVAWGVRRRTRISINLIAEIKFISLAFNPDKF
jgi:hypothetical protein